MLKDFSCFTAPTPLTKPEILTPNVAPNGTATQSSNYHHSTRFADPDYAFYAIDGIFATDILDAHARCSLTLNNSPGNWWRLDLLSNHILENIALTTRKYGGMFLEFSLLGLYLNQSFKYNFELLDFTCRKQETLFTETHTLQNIR